MVISSGFLDGINEIFKFEMVLLSDFDAELLFPQAASNDTAISALAVSPMTFFDVYFIIKMNLLKIFINRLMNRCASQNNSNPF